MSDLVPSGSIAACVVSHNTRDVLRACLRSIRAVGGFEQVVVVDNASTDGSPEMIAAEFPEVVLSGNHGNSGYGAAANQAVLATEAPYVLLLNSDTVLQPGAAPALVRYLANHPRAGIVGPRLVYPGGALQASCYGFPSPGNLLLDLTGAAALLRRTPVLRRVLRTRAHAHARIVPWVSGAALVLRREAFHLVGGFDESFFMYFEEVDLCYRLAKGGWEVHFAPVTDVVHLGGASTRQHRAAMAVRFFASLDQFYERHYSDARRWQLAAVVRAVAVARLTRSLVSWSTRDPDRRSELLADRDASRRLLRGDWQVAEKSTGARDQRSI